MTTLTARNGEVTFGPGLPTLLINDQLRIMDQSEEVLEQLMQGQIDKLLELARRGHAKGMQAVDILINHIDLDEVELLPKIAAAVHAEIGCPISLDSREPEALEAALDALKPHKMLINSVTSERHAIEALMPVAKQYNAAVVAMPLGDIHGLPPTVEGRMEELDVFLKAAEEYDIPREDIVVDTICLASSAEPGSMWVTLETTRKVHELGLATMLGIGNAGFGMPEQTVIDLAYLIAAITYGLSAALVDPETAGLLETVLAIDFLTGNDLYGANYIENYRAKKRLEKA